MKNWNVYGTSEGTQFVVIDGDDWGKEIVNGYGIQNISHIELINEKQKVMFFVRKGVITIGESSIKLGLNLGGYAYTLYDECIYTLEEAAPLTTAIYSSVRDASVDLGKHFMVKYKITHYACKHTKEKIKLKDPIIKEFLLFIDKVGYLTIC